jgi:uncharacterized protein YjbI with pentapeptide repeats
MKSSAPAHSDYSGQDIRGRNFRGADLHGACFAGAIAGLRPVVQILLVIGAVLAVGLAGLVSGYASALPALYAALGSSTRVQLVGLIEAIALPAILATLWKSGLGRALGIVIGSLAIFTAVVAYAGRGDDSPAAAIILTAVNFFALASVLLTSFALVLLHTLLRRRWWLLPPAVLATPLLLAGIHEGIQISSTEASRLGLIQAVVIAGLVLVLAVLPVLIAIRTTRGSVAFRSLRELCTGITCACGTCFRGACLDEVDFTGAYLPQCDFRDASLRRTRWQSVRLLEESRLEGTYLHQVEVRNLLINGSGARLNYDNLCLRDLDLDGVNLEQASLIAADLSGSTLRGANLVGSRLAETRMYGVNLQHANLTKACVENWAISTDTCFDDVICSEIYLRLPTEEDPDPWRKPDNRDDSFKPGDFKDFVAPILRTLGLYQTQDLDLREVGRSMRTLDLYHYNAINPAAAVVAMNQLAIQNPETAMELVALEGKGEDKVHLQAVISGSTSSSSLSRQYQELYQNASTLPSAQLQQLMEKLAQQSEQLSHMESLLSTAKQSQTNYYIKAGEISGIVNFGHITGNVST